MKKYKCPFAGEFGKWIICPYYSKVLVDGRANNRCPHIATGGSWCAKMVGKAMLVHKIFIGNDY